jgi:vesicle transport through interaction with t-SNAREs protein 1
VSLYLLQVKEYKADLASLREQLKQAASGSSEGDAARAELGLGDNYYSTSGETHRAVLSLVRQPCRAAA